MSDHFVCRRLPLPLLSLLFGFVAPPILADDSPQRLRVLSYNIHHGEGVDGVLDLPRIARVIRSVDPDVVALQEVDQNVERTGMVDQPTELARMTEMEVAFGANIELQGGHYGNAILSRLPIVRHTNHRLPSRDDGEQRGVLAAELTLPGADESFAFLATHFDHRRDDRERLASAKAVDVIVNREPQKPTILAGDLNDVPSSRVLKVFAGRWTRVNENPLPTIPVDRPTRQIDYILVRPAERWRVIDVRVLEESVASDHRAIFAELELCRHVRGTAPVRRRLPAGCWRRATSGPLRIRQWGEIQPRDSRVPPAERNLMSRSSPCSIRRPADSQSR